LGCPALLPNAYCPDVHERLSLYKRLSSAEAKDTIEDIQSEIIDRFGDMPDQAQTLIDNHRLRLVMEKMGIKKIEATPEAIKVQFIPNPPIDSMKIIQLIQKDRFVQLSGQDRLRISPNPAHAFADLTQRTEALKRLLASLA
jgi:transcription-repair coupling factor (superfamily II helicase)